MASSDNPGTLTASGSTTLTAAAKAAVPLEPEPPKFATREDFLSAASKRAEAEVDVEGIGKLLLQELSGADRADIISRSATAMNAGKLDVQAYHRSILHAGIVDPLSAADDRQPLFREADIGRVMKVGGKALLKVIDRIEQLSAMGVHQESAEGNSAPTPNGAGTSA